jgi:hypothetical protein
VVAGATGYKVYRTDTPGTYGATALRATIGSGATVTYVDNGDALVAGTVKLANTTGGAAPMYGAVPSLTTAPLYVGTLKPGQQFYFWVGWVIGAVVEQAAAREFFISVREG